MRGIPICKKELTNSVLKSIAPTKKEQTMAARILFKVEKERVLVPVGEPCPFGCKYCYTRGGEVGLSKIKAENVLLQFQNFASTTQFETIQFGYDGDRRVRVVRVCGCGKGFDQLYPYCQTLFRETWIGSARILAAPLAELIERLTPVIREHPNIIRCSDTCLRCQDAALDGPIEKPVLEQLPK